MFHRHGSGPMVFLFSTAMLLALPGLAREIVDPAAPWDPLFQEEQLVLPEGIELPGEAIEIPALDEAPKHFVVERGIVTPKATLFREYFEFRFPNHPWTTYSESSIDVQWGSSTFRSSSGEHSVWCAQNGADAPAPGQDVPPSTASWMVVGPFDLSRVSSGRLSFSLWLETEANFDTFSVGSSTDGNTFSSVTTSQNTNGWQPVSQDLANWPGLGTLIGRSEVWFAFVYASDASVTAEGAYVDELVLEGNTDLGGELDLRIHQIDAGDCPTVRAMVGVSDEQGNPVAGFTDAHFTLMEDGVFQAVSARSASPDGSDLALTLVLDGSSYLCPNSLAFLKAAVNVFIDLLGPNVRLAVFHFGSDVTLMQDFTRDKSAAKQAVDALRNNLGATSLYDAVAEAAQHSTAVGGRRALLVMTEGHENDSVRTQEQAIIAARSAGVPVFTIGFDLEPDQDVLRRLASQTGGFYFFEGEGAHHLLAVLDHVRQIFDHQYILTWSTPTNDGGSHHVIAWVESEGRRDSGNDSYTQADTPCAGGGAGCTPGTHTLCLNRGRFRVEVEWTDPLGVTGLATVADCGSDDAGTLWFFDSNNWEILIKVLDGCAVNNHFWVFSAATTDVGFELRITDTETGIHKTYRNPRGRLAQPIGDTSAFATCP